MNTIDIIKNLCKSKGTSLKALEQELGYSNGSLAKAKVIPSDRILELSRYFDVSMEYLMTGKDTSAKEFAKDENERRLLMLCRNATEANPDEKKNLVDTFESTIDIYLKAKGLK